jgi:hypothetical protein
MHPNSDILHVEDVHNLYFSSKFDMLDAFFFFELLFSIIFLITFPVYVSQSDFTGLALMVSTIKGVK